MIELLSFNVRGIANFTKRCDVFNWLKQKKTGIYMLQDLHCDVDNVTQWEHEWGSTCFFAPGTSNSRGVGILFDNSLDYTVHKKIIDPGGNYIFLDITIQGYKLTLGCIYGPNKDNPSFYTRISDTIEALENLSIIIAGDWNLVSNYLVDTKGYLHFNNPKAHDEVEILINTYDLVDIWRSMHPDDSQFTWHQPTLRKFGRLDYFLVSPDIQSKTIKSNISYGYKSDHSLITLNCDLNNVSRGRGFWKLNTSFLSDLEYVKQINESIIKIIRQYVVNDNLLKEMTKIEDIDYEKINFSIDYDMLWEMIKMEIRSKSISYAVFKKRERESTEAEIENKINNMNIQVNQELNVEREALIRELEDIRNTKVRGAIIRSKSQWMEDGEKSSKFFFGLEKRNFLSKTLTNIIVDEENITNPKQLLDEQGKFYSNLYESKVELNRDNFRNFSNLIFPVLSDEDKNSLEDPITLQECCAVLKNLDKGKSPGTDGLPGEFYKVFWNKISPILILTYKLAFMKGEMSISQRRGIISVIPKKIRIKDTCQTGDQ